VRIRERISESPRSVRTWRVSARVFPKVRARQLRDLSSLRPPIFVVLSFVLKFGAAGVEVEVVEKTNRESRIELLLL
jgi:hypothetical protein